MSKLKPFNLDLPQSVRNALGNTPSFQLAMNHKDDELELIVSGIVGDKWDGVAADQVMKMLSENRDTRVHARINSPGGLAFEGIAIYNALLNHPGGVVTTIEAMAGSAASIIAMAGRPVRMQANASLFIHRGLALAIGNAAVMRDVADFLDDLDAGIVETYQAKTGLSKRKINELMAGAVDGTNMRAVEAKELGFVDEVLDLKPAEKKNARNQKSESSTMDIEKRDAEALKLRREVDNRLLSIAAQERLSEIGA